nr:Chain C, Microtubule-associated protein RP/EB family member 1 [synthetic construct]
EEQEEY